MAQGILDDSERIAIVSYLLRTHFEEQAAKSVLDEGPVAETDAGGRSGHRARAARRGGRGPGSGERAPAAPAPPPWRAGVPAPEAAATGEAVDRAPRRDRAPAIMAGQTRAY